MGLDDTIRRFGEQFDWEPVVENIEKLRPHTYALICGMGGSALGPWLLGSYGKLPDIFVHRDYGLPELPKGVYDDVLVILSSYSGTTEEVLDAGQEALRRGYKAAAIATGGKLIEFAREHALPHCIIPDAGLEPRLAIGFSMLGISLLLSNSALETAVRSGGKAVDATRTEVEGRTLGKKLHGKVPVVYTSSSNASIGYIWKIKFNETAKIPSFLNSFPEACHNELCGFDVADSTRDLSGRMCALFLHDESDHPRNQKRMMVEAEMLGERGIPIEHLTLSGIGFEKAFASAVLADWATFELAAGYGVPDAPTPLVAEFKERIGQ